MDKPKRKKLDERFKWTWQYALNKRYNQAYDEWEAYHKSSLKEVVEVYEEIKENIYNFDGSIVSKPIRWKMWNVIKTVAERIKE